MTQKNILLVKQANQLVDSLLEQTPNFGVFISIKRQLQAFLEKAENNSLDEQFLKSLTMGRLAARELEEMPDSRAMKLAELIYQIREEFDW